MGKYLPDIRQGDTYRVRIRYPKGSNIAGFIHWLALRTAIGADPPLLLLRSVVGEHPSDQPEEGIAYLEATPEQTAALPANKRCVYGLLVKSPSGEDHPGPIIAAVTNLSSATTGLKSGSVSATLEPGRLYWASVLSSGSPGLIGIVTAAANGDYAVSDSDYMTAITHQYLSGVSSMAAYASGALGAVVSGTWTAPAMYLYE